MKDEEYQFVTLDYKDVEKMLSEFDLKQKSWGRKLMQEVNKVAKQKIRKIARSRGYSTKHEQPWGDSGYSKNLKSYANNDFSGKVTMKRDAFYYRFIESGANVKWRHRKGGFYYKPNPFIKTTSDQVWSQEAPQIMNEAYKKIIAKWQEQQK